MRQRAIDWRPKVKNYKEGRTVHYGRVKRDGYRLTIGRTVEGEGFALGRKEDYFEKLTRSPWFVEMMAGIPNGTIVDGELFGVDKQMPGGKAGIQFIQASSVPTLMNEADPRLTYEAFALPMYFGEDWREREFAEVEAMLEGLQIPFPQGFEVPGTADARMLIHDALSLGIEGFVLYEKHYHGWYKLKPQKTVDAIVTSWDVGTGKYFGDMGSLSVSVYKDGDLVEIGTVGTGYNDEQREKFTKDKMMGKVIEVEYQDVAAKGRLKFARFLRIRQDKAPEECRMEQLK